MFTTDFLISTSYVEVQRALVNVESNFGQLCSKSGSDGQEKSEEEINFHWMRGVSALAQKKHRLWQDEKFSDNHNLYHEA